jgi:predicted metal-dependent phosphoesterase TrpH
MSRFDLHVHSTSSDGTVPADELPALIAGAGLGGFALTDHDTTAGHVAAEQAAEAVGVRFIPGVEISADRGKPRGTMHILGFGVRRGTAELDQVISELHAARSERAPIIVDKLNDLGIDITMDEVDAYAGCAMIGRPHIAGVLMNKGYVGSIKEGFTRYISVAVVLRLVRARRPARRCSRPAPGQLRQLHAELVQVQAGDLLVEVLGQHVDRLG